MSDFIIYKTTNLINGKIYVGKHTRHKSSFGGYVGSRQLKTACNGWIGISKIINNSNKE